MKRQLFCQIGYLARQTNLRMMASDVLVKEIPKVHGIDVMRDPSTNKVRACNLLLIHSEIIWSFSGTFLLQLSPSFCRLMTRHNGFYSKHGIKRFFLTCSTHGCSWRSIPYAYYGSLRGGGGTDHRNPETWTDMERHRVICWNLTKDYWKE